jgi:hypothetical protein
MLRITRPEQVWLTEGSPQIPMKERIDSQNLFRGQFSVMAVYKLGSWFCIETMKQFNWLDSFI